MKLGTPELDEEIPHGPDGIDHFRNARGIRVTDQFYHCPCCGYPSLCTRGSFELCPICYWEDDGQDEHDSSRVRGGPNGHLSLDMARAHYAAFGACETAMIKYVRSPTEEETGNRKHG